MKLSGKKIGIDARELIKGRFTGIARFLLNFLRYAPKTRSHWEFVIFGNQNTFFQTDFPNMKKIIIPERSTIFWDQMALPRCLKNEKIDVFFSPYYKTPIFSPCPTVITIHDIIPFIKSGNPLLKSWSVFMAKKAKKIITVSSHSKKDIMDFFKIRKQKIEVIYECAGKTFGIRRKDEVEKAKTKYGIKGKYIFYVGNFKTHKNVDGLLRAYARIAAEFQNEFSFVIGGGDMKNLPRIKKLSQKLGIRQKTIFPGFIDENDLPSIYTGAEIFAFPSFYEGFGLPPLEAMACGTPVIASNRTSLPEILGDAAVLINPEDPDKIARAMEKLFTDGKLTETLRDKGLEKTKEFSQSKMGEKILSIFEEI